MYLLYGVYRHRTRVGTVLFWLQHGCMMLQCICLAAIVLRNLSVHCPVMHNVDIRSEWKPGSAASMLVHHPCAGDPGRLVSWRLVM